MKTLRAALLFVAACASGGTPAEQPGPNPDGPPTPTPDAPEQFIDAPMMHPDAAPDTTMVTPDAPPPDACVPSQNEKLVNPFLDLAPIGTMWTEIPIPNVPGGPLPLIISSADGALVASLPNAIWLGGITAADVNPPTTFVVDEVFQDITFPADATGFIVSGQIALASQDDPSTAFDGFSLDVIEPVGGAVIENIVQADNTTAPRGSYITFNKALTSNLAGRTVRLSAISGNDDLFPTSFFLDSLSFKATFCP